MLHIYMYIGNLFNTSVLNKLALVKAWLAVSLSAAWFKPSFMLLLSFFALCKVFIQAWSAFCEALKLVSPLNLFLQNQIQNCFFFKCTESCCFICRKVYLLRYFKFKKVLATAWISTALQLHYDSNYTNILGGFSITICKCSDYFC